MKRLIIFLAIPFACALFCSLACTKTTHDTTTEYDTVVYKNYDTLVQRDTVVLTLPKIVGTWTGTYKVNGLPSDSFSMTMYIMSNDTATEIGGGIGGSTAGSEIGPWSLSGTTFTATMVDLTGSSPEPIQTMSASYDSVSGRLYNGQLSNSTSGTITQTGTFYLHKVE